MKILLIVFFLCSGCVTTGSLSIARSSIKARVVIDAGHGGADPGAMSIRGLKEKDVTLDIALRLKRLFNKHLPQVEVVLTRASDKFVTLEERVAVANKKPSDIFLSLHINSNESKDANGFEIYSLDIASDRHAERLAARENKSMKQSQAGFILADLNAYSNRKDSDRLAKFISLGLDKQLSKRATHVINNRGYTQAIFHILFVKMPAVLTELFFISNPKEEKMLASGPMREVIAFGLMTGVHGFLNEKVARAENDPR